MTEVFIRNIIGLLAQIVPCATLCLVPFRGRLRTGTRRAWLKAGAIVAVGLVPFLLVATMPVPDATYFWVLVRKTCQNLVFLAIVVALLVLYAREVDADRSHKAFAFSLVALYGFLVTFTTSNASALLRLDEGSDGFMYRPASSSRLSS